jgi:hypothetical protein
MTADTSDTLMRMAAFEHVRRLGEVHDHLTATQLKPGFAFQGERIPLINPQRGIFKLHQMRFLLSIKTVFPKPGGKVWYDDQREVHRQIFSGDETVDYAFMGQNPDAADNRWLREAFENQILGAKLVTVGCNLTGKVARHPPAMAPNRNRQLGLTELIMQLVAKRCLDPVDGDLPCRWLRTFADTVRTPL